MNSGSEFYNYKGFFSIVLFALVDANYNFLFVDIGCQGRISDGGVFRNTTLFKRLNDGSLNIIEPKSLPNREKKVPYVIVADEAFTLNENIMKPYSGTHPKGSLKRIYNYRHCRARRVVENVFGILSSVFRVLRKPMLLEPKKAEVVVMACVYLHNFLRSSSTSKNTYSPPGTFDREENGHILEGSWRETTEQGTSLISLQKVARKSTVTAQEIRDEYATYFATNPVSWQHKCT